MHYYLGGWMYIKNSESGIIDLGAIVTEDLPKRVWGKAFMNLYGFKKNSRKKNVKFIP